MADFINASLKKLLELGKKSDLRRFFLLKLLPIRYFCLTFFKDG